MTLITSRQNTYIKHLTRLLNEPAYRLKQKALLIEGKSLCKEALYSLKVKNCILKEGQHLNEAPSTTHISESVLDKLTALKNPEGYLAEIERPEDSSLEGLKKILVLDGLQNPGNLGALLRSALAFGIEGVFLTQTTVDPYHPKVIRASMGAVLQIPLRVGSKDELLEYFKKEEMNVFVAEAKGQPISTSSIQEPFALVLGKESEGSSLKDHPSCTKLALPIDQVDSLNVAIAGSLLMYLMREKL